MTIRPVLLALATASLAAAPAAADTPILGTWANPKSTIEVRTRNCGGKLCGAITRATPKAMADAQKAGVGQLIGIELLQGYRQTHAGNWTGRVYVPDLGRTFSSTIVQTSPDTLKISGCLVGGFLCKSQVWHRTG